MDLWKQWVGQKSTEKWSSHHLTWTWSTNEKNIETWDLCNTSRWNSKHTAGHTTLVRPKNGMICETQKKTFKASNWQRLKHKYKSKDRNPRAMPRYVVRRWPRKDAQQQPPIESVTQVPSTNIEKDSDVVTTVLNGKCYNCWKGRRYSVMKTGGQFQRTALRVSIWELCRELSK